MVEKVLLGFVFVRPQGGIKNRSEVRGGSHRGNRIKNVVGAIAGNTVIGASKYMHLVLYT